MPFNASITGRTTSQSNPPPQSNGAQTSQGGPPPAQNIAQQGLNGSAAQRQSFLQALTQAGAGSNNGFETSRPMNQQSAAPLLGPGAMGNNGNAGGGTLQTGFRGDPGGVNRNLPPGSTVQMPDHQNATVNGNQPAQGYLGGANGTSNGPPPGYSFPGGGSPNFSYMPNSYYGTASSNLAPGVANGYGNGQGNGGQINYGSLAQNPAFAQALQNYMGSQTVQMPNNQTATASMTPNYAGLNMSDRSQKTDVTEGGGQVQSFLDALNAHQYQYKNPERDGEGTHFSVMAQELEKTPVGKRAVIQTPNGKMVNYAALQPSILASMALLNKRLNKLEKGDK